MASDVLSILVGETWRKAGMVAKASGNAITSGTVLCGVYSIVNVANGKTYIGSSVNIYKRWKHHQWLLRTGRHTNNHLQNAWNTYGEKSFYCCVLEESAADKLRDAEQRHLDNSTNGYNIAQCVDSPLRGTRHSREHCARISRAKLGHSTSPEAREKMRAAKLGKRLTREHRAKISAANTGRQCPKSNEHRAKLRAANLGRQINTEQYARFRAAISSPEYLEKQRVSHTGRRHSKETREKMSASHRRRLLIENKEKRSGI